MKNFLLGVLTALITVSLGFAAGYLWPIQTNDDAYALLDSVMNQEVGLQAQPVQFWTEQDVTDAYTDMHRQRYVDSVFLQTDLQTILSVSHVLLRDTIPLTPEMIVNEFNNHQSVYNGIRKVPIRDTIVIFKALEANTELHDTTTNGNR